MKLPLFLRRSLRIVVVACLLLLLAACVALSNAKVEMTAGGAHQRLVVPVVLGAAGINIYTGTGESVSIPGFLAGPVLQRHADGSWDARWFCEDHVAHASGDSAELRIDCGGRTHVFPTRQAPVAAAVAPMPAKLVVLSDLEGNAAFLGKALRKLGVVDGTGAWAYGHGQLVVLGDAVDRGRDVFEVLWQLHDLSIQADAAGGALHFVIGNHEQYLLRGNTSRAHPDYRYAVRQLGGPDAVFAAGTELGDWLRRQPVMLSLGAVLFTHGGISRDVVASGLDAGRLNAAMHDYWAHATGKVAHTPALDAVIGRMGLTQYRGYFRGIEGIYAQATQADVGHALAHFGAGQVVVGHTLVEGVKPLYGGKVYAVDVNHPEAESQVLLYEDGVPRVLDLGISRGLQREEPVRLRGFSLLDAGDRRMLGDIYRGFERIAEIPHPY